MHRALTIVLVFIAFTSEAQLTNFSEIWKGHEFKGDQLYEDGLYEAAIEAYQKQLVDDPNNKNAIIKIAEAYKHLGNYKMAGRYFHTLGRSFQLPDQYLEEYADVLLAEGNLEEALGVYHSVLDKNPENKVVQAKIHGIENWDNFFTYQDFAEIENTPFNTEAAEFGIRKFAQGMAFTSSRIDDGLVRHNYLRDAGKLTALYTVASETDNSAQLLELEQLKKSNDGPHAVFGYNYVISRSFPAANNSGAVLGLYFYQLQEDGSLEMLQPFDFNSPEYSITHPAYNSRGDTLYFVSDMPSGFGGFDLYYSIYRNNSWSPPVNLGDLVNTAGDELFPYSDNGKFYFSSNGRAGLGGLDLYNLVSEDDSSYVENMGAPVNSGWDDFGIYIEGNEGYISSNRPGGKGLDDIYKVKLLPRPK
jgi:tetratricopeptide (TPR) repeat protein